MPLLSVLDQSPVRSGGTPADAIHETLDLARAADRLGYHRYWLAEHHSTAGLLGSSGDSAAYAAHFGTAFSFAHFINDEGGPEVVRAYREHFRPSPWLDAPRASVAAFAVCADTEAEAERLARSRDLFLVRLRTGRPGPYPAAVEALAHPYTPLER